MLQFISFGRSEIFVFMEVLFGSLWLFSSSFGRVLKSCCFLVQLSSWSYLVCFSFACPRAVGFFFSFLSLLSFSFLLVLLLFDTLVGFFWFWFLSPRCGVVLGTYGLFCLTTCSVSVVRSCALTSGCEINFVVL